MTATNQDVFAQLAAEQAASAAASRPLNNTATPNAPPASGDVFAQIHAANQQATSRPSTPAPQDQLWNANAIDASILAQMQKQYPNATSPKTIAATAGSLLLPEAVPEAGWLAHAVLSGAGAGLGTLAGQAATGQNPFTGRSLEESGVNAAAMASLDGLFGAIPAIAEAKLGRSFVNESLGANPADVIYGNPAKAIEREGILSPMTGDIEKMKAAGNDLTAAGGRLGQVAQRIQQLQPQLNQALSKSPASISVADAIDKPLTNAFNDIIDNSAMTDAEKMAAITQLGGLQSALHEGIGTDISALKANQLKNLLGSRVRWNGTNAIGDEVKPAYKAVYVSLKNAVNNAVPEMADLNSRLTDLYAAQDDLLQLARREEVGRGMGMMRGTMGTSMIGRVEGELGRFFPGTAAASSAAQVGSKFVAPALGTETNPDVRVSLQDLLSQQQ